MGSYTPMELLVIGTLILVFGVLALRYGHDSRRVIQSKEEELASLGMVWDAAQVRMQQLRREADHERLVRLATRSRARRADDRLTRSA